MNSLHMKKFEELNINLMPVRFFIMHVFSFTKVALNVTYSRICLFFLYPLYYFKWYCEHYVTKYGVCGVTEYGDDV